jgi:DNA replication and repair protein RecF
LRIRRIHLKNFRNFADTTVELGERRNLILGANAQGKTNLLEAIHILGVGRSHRDRKDANLVRFGQDFYRIEGIFDHIGVKTTIEVGYGTERKRIRVNGKDSKPADLIGLVGVVISSPDDIDLVKGSPGLRRVFLDMAISQMSRDYLTTLQQYLRAVSQRNRLLRAAQERRDRISETAVWDRSVGSLGAKIVRLRVAYLEEIQPLVEANFALISGMPGEVTLLYEPKGYRLGSADEMASGLDDAIREHKDVEVARGYTLYGPHVDDFKFLTGGHDLRQFGSEGEQRTGVLALRCAEVAAMRDKMGRHPIVLLDDVFAELDSARAKALTALISRFDQIILTSSRPGPLQDEEIHRIRVSEGSVISNGRA